MNESYHQIPLLTAGETTKRGTVARVCEQCGQPFFARPYQVAKGTARFCSTKCHDERRRVTMRRENNPAWKGGAGDLVCEHCGKAFHVRPSHASRRGFCTAACKRAAGDPRPHRTTNASHVCDHCGKTFTTYVAPVTKAAGDGKYCSRECYGLAKQRRAEVICAHCGITFTAKVTDIARDSAQCCSRRCQGLHTRQTGRLRGVRNPRWKGGEPRGRVSVMARIEYKEWRVAVFTRDGYICQKCNQHGGKLHAHHIERWKDAPELRYAINNGTTLCVECHRDLHWPNRHKYIVQR